MSVCFKGCGRAIASLLLILSPFALLTSHAPLPVAAQSIQNHKAEADRLFQQGIQQYQTSQFEAAFQSWQQALTLYRSIKNRFGEGAALSQLGLGYEALGNYDEAIVYLEQLLAYAREVDDPIGQGFALSRLGSTYLGMGQYDPAIDAHQQSLAIAQKLKNQGGEGQELRNLGIVYFSKGSYDKAIEAYQQSLTLARELKEPQWEGLVLIDLGTAYHAVGEATQAIAFLKQGLAIARSIQDRTGEISALGNLGLVYYDQADYTKAIEAHQQSLEIARSTQDSYAEGIALNNMGLALFRAGRLLPAEQTLQACIQVLEALRSQFGNHDAAKLSLFEQQLRTYRTLQQVLSAQQKIDAALEVSEQGRARAFVELLSTRLGKDQSPIMPSGASTIAAPTAEQIKQIAKTHNATLVQYSIIYDAFKIGKKTEWKESQLYIWVVAPNGTINFRTTDLKPLWQQQQRSLADLVVQSREVIGARGRSDIGITLSPELSQAQQQQQTQHLQQWHELLIQPIAPLLPSDPNQRVIFIPQGELFLVPFPALTDAQGTALIEQHTILTAPSIQVLELTRQQADRRKAPIGKGALIVGNPEMPKVVFEKGEEAVQLSDLPGARQEAIAIAKLFNTKAITGKQATEPTIVQQMPNARFIHLATHGLLEGVKNWGMPGAIALAPSGNGQSGDGLLTANEILKMKLQAELVVLSACDTGRGRITGDGVIGLSRSLIAAGVPSVVVSLWKVPDDSTHFLMTQFYQNLQKTPDKAQALRQAMLTAKQKYTEPLDWAAFTLIGEAE